MGRSLRSCVLIAALVLSTASLAKDSDLTGSLERTSSMGNSQDIADIQHVMEAFHHAVITHDGFELGDLFIPEGSTWLNVLSDEAYARAKLKSPDVPKIRTGSYQAFASFVSNSKATLEP